MNEYKLNYLRWLTQDEFSDDVLKTVTHLRLEDGQIKFNCRVDVSTKDWTHVFGHYEKR